MRKSRRGLRTCCVCGNGYHTKNIDEDILVYGCRACQKGWWEKTQENLKEIEISELEPFFPYGKKREIGQPLNLIMQNLGPQQVTKHAQNTQVVELQGVK